MKKTENKRIKSKILVIFVVCLLLAITLGFLSLKNNIFDSKTILVKNICNNYNNSSREIDFSNSSFREKNKEDVQLLQLSLYQAFQSREMYDYFDQNPIKSWTLLNTGLAWQGDGDIPQEKRISAFNRYKNILSLNYLEAKNISRKEFELKYHCGIYKYELNDKNTYTNAKFETLNSLTTKEIIFDIFFSSENQIEEILNRKRILLYFFKNQTFKEEKISESKFSEIRKEYKPQDNREEFILYNEIPEIIKFTDNLYSFKSLDNFEEDVKFRLNDRRNKPLKGEIERIKIFSDFESSLIKEFDNKLFILGKNYLNKKENTSESGKNTIANIYDLKEKKIIWSLIGDQYIDEANFATKDDKIAIIIKNPESKKPNSINILDMKTGQIQKEFTDNEDYKTEKIEFFDGNNLILKQTYYSNNDNSNNKNNKNRLFNFTTGEVIKINIQDWDYDKSILSDDLKYQTTYKNSDNCNKVTIYNLNEKKALFSQCVGENGGYITKDSTKSYFSDKKLVYLFTTYTNEISKVEIDLETLKYETKSLSDKEGAEYNFGGRYGFSIDKNIYLNKLINTGSSEGYFIYSNERKYNFKPHPSIQRNKFDYFVSNDKKLLYLSTRSDGIIIIDISKIFD